MKTLKVKDKDLCVYGDYLNQSAADEFVSGSYTHIQRVEDNSIAEAELVGQMNDGWPMVVIGENIG